MKQRRNRSLLFLSLVLCVLASACGSSVDEVETGTIGRISEQNIEGARQTLDAAKVEWASQQPLAHTFRSGIETISMIEIVFDADGVPGEEVVLFGEADPEGWSYVPRSVDEAFAEIEAILARFESGEWPVPDEGECGSHFHAEFDPVVMVPIYYDTLGPCDDGVGVRIEVIPAGAQDDGPTIPEAPCAEGDFYGTWQSPQVDGVSSAVVLVLQDGTGSYLEVGDTTTAIDEWFCNGSQLIAIGEGGEEWTVAELNEDGTLTASGETLTRA